MTKNQSCSKVKVYDISGRFTVEVNHSWNGRNSTGEEVNPGIYFLKVDRVNNRKVVKLR